MRDAIYKYMPLVFGAVLGWMLFHPPAFMEALGPLSWLINGGLVALLFLSSIPLIIIANLPGEPRLDPVAAQGVPAELKAQAAELEGLGFRPACPPAKVNVAPAALLLGFVHESEPVYATLFRTDTVPAKTGGDFVSILASEKGGLTTNADPNGAALPAGPGGLRQVLPGASLATLFKEHLDGITYLRSRGIAVRTVSADTFAQDFRNAMQHQRRHFLSSPIVGSLVTLWRATTKQVPFVGSLRQQRVADQQIRKLLGAPSHG